MCSSDLDADLYQYTGFYLQKAATFSRFPATTGRELQPPKLVYQPLLEGSYNPLIKTLASTSILKASTLRTTADHVSSIFILDKTASTQLFININNHKIYPILQSKR